MPKKTRKQPPDTALPQPSEETSHMKWYALFIPRNTEHKIKGLLRVWLRSIHREKELGEIVHPKEKIVFKYYYHREKESWKSIFPSYLFLQMEPQLLPLVQDLLQEYFPRAHYLGNDPLLFQKLENILGTIQKPLPPKPLSFVQGDQVRVIDGAFANFSATVENVDPEKRRIRAIVVIFGRSTPVEFSPEQLEKIK